MVWNPGDLLKTTKSIRTNWSIIRKLESQKTTAFAALKFYRKAGLKGSTAAFGDLFKAFRYASTNPAIYLNPDSSKKPNWAMIPHSPINQKKRYRVVVEYDIHDMVTGTIETKHLTLSSTDLLTQDEYLTTAYEVAQEYTDEGRTSHLVNEISEMTYTNTPTLS